MVPSCLTMSLYFERALLTVSEFNFRDHDLLHGILFLTKIQCFININRSLFNCNIFTKKNTYKNVRFLKAE